MLHPLELPRNNRDNQKLPFSQLYRLSYSDCLIIIIHISINYQSVMITVLPICPNLTGRFFPHPSNHPRHAVLIGSFCQTKHAVAAREKVQSANPAQSGFIIGGQSFASGVKTHLGPLGPG